MTIDQQPSLSLFEWRSERDDLYKRDSALLYAAVEMWARGWEATDALTILNKNGEPLRIVGDNRPAYSVLYWLCRASGCKTVEDVEALVKGLNMPDATLEHGAVSSVLRRTGFWKEAPQTREAQEAWADLRAALSGPDAGAFAFEKLRRVCGVFVCCRRKQVKAVVKWVLPPTTTPDFRHGVVRILCRMIPLPGEWKARPQLDVSALSFEERVKAITRESDRYPV